MTSSNVYSADAYAGRVFADYIRSQLTEERARKDSLERRGTGIVATAGTLSTFLFGIASFSRSSTTAFQLSRADAGALVGALLLMLTAGILGLVTNRIRDYGEASTGYLQELTRDDEDHWRWSDVVGAQALIARADVKTLTRARNLNDGKATALQWALRAETLAILALAIAVTLVLFKT